MRKEQKSKYHKKILIVLKRCFPLIKKINIPPQLPVSLNIEHNHEEDNLTLISEPKIFQIYKTYNISQHSRNILDTSAVMYIRSKPKKKTIKYPTDHKQPTRGHVTSKLETKQPCFIWHGSSLSHAANISTRFAQSYTDPLEGKLNVTANWGKVVQLLHTISTACLPRLLQLAPSSISVCYVPNCWFI